MRSGRELWRSVEKRGREHASWGRRRFDGLKDWWLLLLMAFGLCLFREKVDDMSGTVWLFCWVLALRGVSNCTIDALGGV